VLFQLPVGAASTPVVPAMSSGSPRPGNIADGFAPRVTGLNPLNGAPAGRTVVHIYGTGLLGATAVRFGSLPAVHFVVASDGEIAALSPPGGRGKPVDITVVTQHGSSAASAA